MQRHLISATSNGGRTVARPPHAAAARAVVVPGGFGQGRREPAGEARGALITCVLAMYPLVGSATIILAALMLAGGIHA